MWHASSPNTLLAEGHDLISTPCLLLVTDCHPGNWLVRFERCMGQVFKKVEQQGPEFVGSLRPTPFVVRTHPK